MDDDLAETMRQYADEPWKYEGGPCEGGPWPVKMRAGATEIDRLCTRIEELEENCSQLLSKSDTIKIELDEAGEDGENVRAELRRVSDRCRQIADQYTAMLTRAEQAEARIAVDAGFDAKDARIAELERWAKLYVETLDRAQRAEARVAELEAYLKEDGFNV